MLRYRTPALDGSGVLGLRQRVAYALSAVRESLRPGRRGRAPALGLEPRAAAALQPPSGRLARSAEELAASLLPPWLLAHSARTWAWGALLGLRDGQRCDGELLYAASLLHDLGLCERHLAPGGTCFALHGAREARAALLARGADPVAAGRIAAAIAAHLDVRVGGEQGTEAQLLSRGAALDVVGREARSLARPLRDQVLARWPRQGMKARLRPLLEAEARRAPRTRLALLLRLGFGGRIAAAPFEEEAGSEGPALSAR